MCREFNAKMIVWCLTKTRFPSRPCFVYGLWNVPLGKTWSLFVCLVRRTCKKKKKKKKQKEVGTVQTHGALWPHSRVCARWQLHRVCWRLFRLHPGEKNLLPFPVSTPRPHPLLFLQGQNLPLWNKNSHAFPTFPALGLQPTFLGTL